MEELDKYKEAFRLACHHLIISQSLIFQDVKLFDEQGEMTDEFIEELHEAQESILGMAEENLRSKE